MINADCPNCLNFNKSCQKQDISIIDGKCQQYNPNDIKYHIHQYYRGALLPAICNAMGESNQQYTHDRIIKPEWIYSKTGKYYFEVSGYNDIPNKYYNACQIMVDADGQVLGYIPSMSKFTQKEAREFILFCENILFCDLGAGMNLSDNQKNSRGRIFK